MDPQFVWNVEDYGGINAIRVPVEKVWTPDIVLLTKYSIILWNGNYFAILPKDRSFSLSSEVWTFKFSKHTYIIHVNLEKQIGWLIWDPAFFSSIFLDNQRIKIFIETTSGKFMLYSVIYIVTGIKLNTHKICFSFFFIQSSSLQHRW